MSLLFAAMDGRLAWWIAAAALAVAEIAIPGVFLIWLALAAAITGAIMLLFDPPALAGFAIFVIAAIASVYVGRNVYRRNAAEPDPLLNDRAARMIGARVTICEAIVAGRGRAAAGDGSWLAQGPDMAAGTVATVVAVEGNVLTVEAIVP